MNHKKRDIINNIAEEIRVLLNITKNKFNIETIVKDLNGNIIKDYSSFNEVTITKSSDDNFEISLSDVSNYQRIRFSIAHELGHLFLHMNYLDEEKWNNIEIGTSHARNTNIPYTEYESEANEFAGAFLMPKSEFIKVANENIEDNYYNLKNISDEFDVSIEVVNARGKTLKLWT
ncbi:Domain of uncharacterised function (DUF955) [Sarcina ventriculi]|uniref:ImmA/IrrE family metallo-endopeptidase n=1 Tax=Sarcina ventriculi TaxID=1267 RepID=UPI000D915BCD|nr:ImmA/IrrE family metallo-endopeptidase [Sarcina ventriculi]SPZ51266.1 Domain of uncharacterised function (DUF955) [Sarcina ventriculi]